MSDAVSMSNQDNNLSSGSSGNFKKYFKGVPRGKGHDPRPKLEPSSLMYDPKTVQLK